MPSAEPMLLSQRVVQACLFLVGAIAVFGGSLQLYLGQPETTPRLDNVHRFMGGIYLMSGVMALWAASTVRTHDTLIYLMAATAFVGGLGRVLSITKVGLPEPHALWIGYLVPELLIPIVIIVAQVMTRRQLAGAIG